MCAGHGLKVLILQPFSNFEGWPTESQQRKDAFDRANGWIDIMEAVGTDMLQVGSSDSRDMSADTDRLAADLASLADILAARGFRLTYENWCWVTWAPKWKHAWDIVKKADRSNIGLCLDTFQTAGGEWGDPTTKSGRSEDGGISPDDLSKAYAASLNDLVKTIPSDKIYFVQISDAYYLDSPLDATADPESGLRPRVQAVLSTGFQGWFSIEVFDGKFEEKYGAGLKKFAKKAMESYQRLLVEGSDSGSS
ncbi:hypothetical protein N0V88_007913 [Collariella sp. IMI 366227]|nr:hypothetical protein N0V88_007913 [Collariella sp. IMI 366227]